MNFLKISEAPNRLSPEQLGEKTENLLNSLKSAITYLNLVKSVIEPLSTIKSKYRASAPSIQFSNNPLTYQLSYAHRTTDTSYRAAMFMYNLFSNNPFGNSYPSIFTTYYVIRIAPSLGTYQTYIGAYKVNIGLTQFYSVNTNYSTVFATGTSYFWGAYLTAPPTTLAVWPAATAATNIVDNPDIAFGTYGQVCAEENTNNLYFFARTRWKRVVLETY